MALLRPPALREAGFILRATHALQLEEMRKNEDPRLSFSTPEFKEAQRIFTENFKAGTAGKHTDIQPRSSWLTSVHLQKNFGKPVEWGLVKDYPWSTPQLRKLDAPVSTPFPAWHQWAMLPMAHPSHKCWPVQVDVEGKPWPLDAAGKPILKA